MDQLSSDRLIATECRDQTREGALWSIALVTDAQAISAGDQPLADLLLQVERLRRQEAGQVVLESCLPEIRCLAMLLAAARLSWDAGASPVRFADEADWLAARIQTLALSHVEVSLPQMSILDQANLRLQRWCAESGQRAVQALPVLLTRPEVARGQMMQRGWSRMPMDGLVQGSVDLGSKVVQALRQRSRERMAPLLHSLYPLGN